jgi:FKBP-type peptidyl-prolyl cis-trans isomerase FkpA
VRMSLNSRPAYRVAARSLAALLAVVSLTSCLNLNVDNPNSQPSDPAHESFDASLHVDISTMKRTPSGVYYKDGPLGDGTPFTGLGTLTITFVGYLKTGALFQQGSDVQIILGNETVGLQEGLQGMRVGGERLIVIPSALGFGNTVTGTVPPNSTLVYDIVVTSVP